MKKILTLVVLLLAVAVAGHAQKLDPRLTDLVSRPVSQKKGKAAPATPKALCPVEWKEVQQRMNITLDEDGTLQSLSVIARLQKGRGVPTAQLEKLGIRVVDVVGRLVILDVPAEQLYGLEQVEELESVEADMALQLMNNRTRQLTGVDAVNGEDAAAFTASGLPAATTDLDYYTGKGVLAGVVDQGIDFNHAAFRKSNGSTRLVAAIMPEYQDNLGLYLHVYAPAAISSLTTDYTEGSHGSHTSATMAGTPITITVGKDETARDIDLRGMAPDADLYLSGLPQLYNSHIVSSVAYIFSYAEEHKMPAVVNLSLGSIGGFYNGTDELAEAISDQTHEGSKPGCVVAISAGNHSDEMRSITKMINPADQVQLKTILVPNNWGTWQNGGIVEDEEGTLPIYENVDIFSYLRSYTPFSMAVKAVDIKTGTVYELASSEEEAQNGYVALYEQTDGGNVVRKLESEVIAEVAQQLDQSGTFFFTDPKLRLALFISGAEVSTELVMQEEAYSGIAFSSGNLEGYTDGDGSLSLNISAVTDGAICVGAYTSRSWFWSMKQECAYHYGEEPPTVGEASDFTSYGTDDFGISRPDVLAPGEYVYSAFNFYDTTTANSGAEDGARSYALAGKTTAHERTQYYGHMQGTSQATPAVAGIIALWLQANPKLCTNDIRRIIRLTADHDDYTDMAEKTPNNDIRQTGMGKINALKGLQLIASEQTNSLLLANADANTSAIATAASADPKLPVSVTLEDRTLYRDNSWNTLCLPFDLDLRESPLTGWGMTVIELDPATSSLDAEGTLTLNFRYAGYTLQAGKPYLIKWDCPVNAEAYAANPEDYDLIAPVFRFVNVNNTVPISVTTDDGKVSFVGTYDPVSIPSGGDPTKLYLGADNKLYWPSTAMTIGCQRAYFQLNNGLEVGDSEVAGTHIRNIVLNLDADTDAEPTAIQALSESLTTLSRLSDDWHTLSGIRLSARPTRPGLYIHQGRKVYVP